MHFNGFDKYHLWENTCDDNINTRVTLGLIMGQVKLWTLLQIEQKFNWSKNSSLLCENDQTRIRGCWGPGQHGTATVQDSLLLFFCSII